MDKSFCHWLRIHSPEKGQLQKGKSRVLDAPIYSFVEALFSYHMGILYESEHHIKNYESENNQSEH